MKQYRIEAEENSILITYPGGTVCRLFRIVPGIILALNRVQAEYLPAMEKSDLARLCADGEASIAVPSGKIFTLNHARRGVCEMQTRSGNYIYVKSGNLCISRESPEKRFRYPTGNYEGIEIYFLNDCRQDSSGLLGEFQIDVNKIEEKYIGRSQSSGQTLENGSTFMAGTPASIKEPLQNLYAMFDREDIDISLLRLFALQILRILSIGDSGIRPITISALTPTQLRMAENAQRTLISHLDQRIPIRRLADEMGISETSLKNYFRAVYGQNISDYLLKSRMAKAKRLLKKTSLPIGEIADRTGYKNQSRFTAAFQRDTGYTPSAWRRADLSASD